MAINMYMANVPSTLYKYVTPERIDILNNLNIRFTQPSALNDPFEFNLSFRELISSTQLHDHFSNIGAEQTFQNILNKMTADEKAIINSLPSDQLTTLKNDLATDFLSLSNIEKINNTHISPNTPRVKNELYSGLDTTIGVLSLTPNCSSPSMWANYADNSKGFVIGFDTQNIFFNRRRSESDEFYHLRKVIYDDIPPAENLSEMNGNLLILKNKCWDYEDEWRMLLPLNTANTEINTDEGNKISLFNYPAIAISHIIFGINATKSTIENITKAITNINPNSQIKIFKATKGATTFEITPM